MQKFTLTVLAIAALAACDRTPPDVKQLAETRATLSPLALSPAHDALRARQLSSPAGGHDELVITPTLTLLALSPTRDNAALLDQIKTFDAAASATRHAFTLSPDTQMTILKALAPPQPSTLRITADAHADAATIAALIKATTTHDWQPHFLQLDDAHALSLSAPPPCPADESDSPSSFVTHCEQCEAGADATRHVLDNCLAPTLHWHADGSWTASLRGATAATHTCITIPERTGDHDALDEMSCLEAAQPDALLDALEQVHTLCDTVTINPLAGHDTTALLDALNAIANHRAARHITLTSMQTPGKPMSCD